MATSSLKWPLRIGAPKSTSDNPTFSDNEGSNPNPNTNDTPPYFTIKHYKGILQYQQLFQFYLAHGHTNVTRRNADNSLAEWASYQTSKMVATDKYDLKWKHLLNGIEFCSSPPPTTTRCSRSTWLHTMFSVSSNKNHQIRTSLLLLEVHLRQEQAHAGIGNIVGAGFYNLNSSKDIFESPTQSTNSCNLCDSINPLDSRIQLLYVSNEIASVRIYRQ
jgi:hypothetical protein